MKNQWRIVLGLVLTLIIVIFAILNNQEVVINFGLSEIKAPLIIVIIGSAFIGAIVISLVATSGYMKQRKTIKELNNQLAADEAAIEQRVAMRVAEMERNYADETVMTQHSVANESEGMTANKQDEHSSIDYFG